MKTQFVRPAAIGLLVAVTALAKGPVAPVNASGSVALKGYDPVAYFEAQSPIKGAKQLTHRWNGAVWRFSSPENRAKFQADPERYAPQFGGYCAYAVSENYTADIDPRAWTVRDGKLYLNYSRDVQKIWLADVETRIKAGEKNWPRLHR